MWIEVIKLRSPGINEDLPDKNLLVKLAQVSRAGGPWKMQIYRHATVESDMAVHLIWKTGFPESGGSAAPGPDQVGSGYRRPPLPVPQGRMARQPGRNGSQRPTHPFGPDHRR